MTPSTADEFIQLLNTNFQQAKELPLSDIVSLFKTKNDWDKLFSKIKFPEDMQGYRLFIEIVQDKNANVIKYYGNEDDVKELVRNSPSVIYTLFNKSPELLNPYLKNYEAFIELLNCLDVVGDAFFLKHKETILPWISSHQQFMEIFNKNTTVAKKIFAKKPEVTNDIPLNDVLKVVRKEESLGKKILNREASIDLETIDNVAFISLIKQNKPIFLPLINRIYEKKPQVTNNLAVQDLCYILKVNKELGEKILNRRDSMDPASLSFDDFIELLEIDAGVASKFIRTNEIAFINQILNADQYIKLMKTNHSLALWSMEQYPSLAKKIQSVTQFVSIVECNTEIAKEIYKTHSAYLFSFLDYRSYGKIKEKCPELALQMKKDNSYLIGNFEETFRKIDRFSPKYSEEEHNNHLGLGFLNKLQNGNNSTCLSGGKLSISTSSSSTGRNPYTHFTKKPEQQQNKFGLGCCNLILLAGFCSGLGLSVLGLAALNWPLILVGALTAIVSYSLMGSLNSNDSQNLNYSPS